MLKIRDDFDLKELEKFGFETYLRFFTEFYRKELKTSDNNAFIKVQPLTRQIIIDTGATFIEEVDVLYDLIKADLVVKE